MIPLLTLALSLPSFAEEMKMISPEELDRRLSEGKARPVVVDVREESEYEAGHIARAILNPLGSIDALDLDKDQQIVLVCRSGRRSASAYEQLTARGYRNLLNLDGGMLAWERLGLPVQKKPAE